MEVWSSLVYGNSLENCRTEMFREFESHRFRQCIESWMSGLNRHPAKVFSTEKWNVGSNPTLSASVNKKQQLPKIVVDKKSVECYTLFID